MLLTEQMAKEGNWLFRWRSFLPLALYVAELAYLRHFHYIGHSEALDAVWEVASLCLSLMGVAVRMITVGSTPRRTSGRNRRCQVADQLNTTGVYSIVRNPLYLGNTLIWLGMAMFAHSFPFFFAVLFVSWLYHERIIAAEESFLSQKFGAAFQAWAARTPVFFPNLKLWQPPMLRFSFKRAVRREYLGLFGVISGFTLLELAGESRVHHGLWLGLGWIAFWLTSLTLFAGVRLIAKGTAWLQSADEVV